MNPPLALAERLAAQGLDWLVPDWPAPAQVLALMTTRQGAAGAVWDVSTRAPQSPEAVAGRTELARLVGRPIAWLDQVHGHAVVEPSTATGFPAADALVLRSGALAGAVQTADCLPVLLCDRRARAVAAAHAGWRGLVAGVLENTVAAMDCPPEDILAWMGAAIGPEAFEVGEEVRAAFLAADDQASTCFRPGLAGKWFADLYGLARLRLARAGVHQVFGGGFCSFREAQRFYSHRRSQDRGRMAAVIWLDQMDV
ncbi:Polyphenol oxidase [Burkholderiales bacterium]|nr:Polyphenol oxidase [Burkholderiales bacterium]